MSLLTRSPMPLAISSQSIRRNHEHRLFNHRLSCHGWHCLLHRRHHGGFSNQTEGTMTAKRTAPPTSKIKTRTNKKPAESEEQRNLRRSNAFRDLETPIFELYLMAEI